MLSVIEIVVAIVLIAALFVYVLFTKVHKIKEKDLPLTNLRLNLMMEGLFAIASIFYGFAEFFSGDALDAIFYLLFLIFWIRQILKSIESIKILKILNFVKMLNDQAKKQQMM